MVTGVAYSQIPEPTQLYSRSPSFLSSTTHPSPASHDVATKDGTTYGTLFGGGQSWLRVKFSLTRMTLMEAPGLKDGSYATHRPCCLFSQAGCMFLLPPMLLVVTMIYLFGCLPPPRVATSCRYAVTLFAVNDRTDYAAPTSNVVITLSYSTADLVITPSTLTFTPTNWETPQTVAVSAIVDYKRERDPEVLPPVLPPRLLLSLVAVITAACYFCYRCCCYHCCSHDCLLLLVAALVAITAATPVSLLLLLMLLLLHCCLYCC